MPSKNTPPVNGAPYISVKFDVDAHAVGLVMLPRYDGYFSYATLRSVGWTDDQLIAAKFARRFFHPLEGHADSEFSRYPVAFWKWLGRNDHVWKEFVKWARESKKSGRARYSASAIVHKMRWESEVVSRNRFKMSDAVTPYLSRLLMAEYPDEFKGYFSTHTRGSHIATEMETGEETEASEAFAEAAGVSL